MSDTGDPRRDCPTRPRADAGPAPRDRHAAARPGPDAARRRERPGRRRRAARPARAARRAAGPGRGPSGPSGSSRRLFLLSMLAGIGFIAAYIGLEVHSVDAMLRSNLALGLSMSVAFLASAIGAMIWVRHADAGRRAHRGAPPAAPPTRRTAQAFAETFAEGAEASQFIKRPLLRRTLIAATRAAGGRPAGAAARHGPAARHQRCGTRSGARACGCSSYGANTPIRPADFSSPGSMITVVPEGYQDDQDALAKATAIIIKFAARRAGLGQPGQARHVR